MTKVTLITGAGRGLGRNAALNIAARGGDVSITYESRADDAHAVVTEIEAMGRRAAAFQLDSGDVSAFPAFVDELRAILRDTWGNDTLGHIPINRIPILAEL